MSCSTYEYLIVETKTAAERRRENDSAVPSILKRGDIPYAGTPKQAEQEAARKIPNDYAASEVEVYVRPFM